MQVETKKNLGMLWKKINLEAKIAKGFDKEPAENVRNQLVQNYLQIFCSDNAKSVESLQTNVKQVLVIEEMEKKNRNNGNEQLPTSKCKSEKQRQSSQFINNPKQMQQMEESIVEKWKLGEDSQHHLQKHKTVEMTQNKSSKDKLKSNLLKVKKNLRQTKQKLSQFQANIQLNHQKIIEQIISQLSQKMEEFMSRYQQNIFCNEIKYNELTQQNRVLVGRNQAFKNQLLIKQNQIDKMTKQIKSLKIENIELNEKIFDLQQKISQWDLQIEKKLKEHIDFNPKNWTISFNNCDKKMELQKSKSGKQFIKVIDGETEKQNEVQKIITQQKSNNNNMVKFNMKDLKIMNFPNKVKVSLQNSLQEKHSLDGQQLLNFKNFRSNPSYNDESSQYLRDKHKKRNYEDSFDSRHRVSSGALLQGNRQQQKNYYYNNKSNLTNRNSNFYLKKAQTPKVKANIFFKPESQHDKSTWLNNPRKHSTPKQYITMSKGFNVQSDLVVNLLNRQQNQQTSKINKLGNKINDLRQEIRKEINATMNM